MCQNRLMYSLSLPSQTKSARRGRSLTSSSNKTHRASARRGRSLTSSSNKSHHASQRNCKFHLRSDLGPNKKLFDACRSICLRIDLIYAFSQLSQTRSGQRGGERKKEKNRKEREEKAAAAPAPAVKSKPPPFIVLDTLGTIVFVPTSHGYMGS